MYAAVVCLVSGKQGYIHFAMTLGVIYIGILINAQIMPLMSATFHASLLQFGFVYMCACVRACVRACVCVCVLVCVRVYVCLAMSHVFYNLQQVANIKEKAPSVSFGIKHSPYIKMFSGRHNLKMQPR